MRAVSYDRFECGHDLPSQKILTKDRLLLREPCDNTSIKKIVSFHGQCRHCVELNQAGSTDIRMHKEMDDLFDSTVHRLASLCSKTALRLQNSTGSRRKAVQAGDRGARVSNGSGPDIGALSGREWMSPSQSVSRRQAVTSDITNNTKAATTKSTERIMERDRVRTPVVSQPGFGTKSGPVADRTPMEQHLSKSDRDDGHLTLSSRQLTDGCSSDLQLIGRPMQHGSQAKVSLEADQICGADAGHKRATVETSVEGRHDAINEAPEDKTGVQVGGHTLETAGTSIEETQRATHDRPDTKPTVLLESHAPAPGTVSLAPERKKSFYLAWSKASAWSTESCIPQIGYAICNFMTVIGKESAPYREEATMFLPAADSISAARVGVTELDTFFPEWCHARFAEEQATVKAERATETSIIERPGQGYLKPLVARNGGLQFMQSSVPRTAHGSLGEREKWSNPWISARSSQLTDATDGCSKVDLAGTKLAPVAYVAYSPMTSVRSDQRQRLRVPLGYPAADQVGNSNSSSARVSGASDVYMILPPDPPVALRAQHGASDVGNAKRTREASPQYGQAALTIGEGLGTSQEMAHHTGTETTVVDGRDTLPSQRKRLQRERSLNEKRDKIGLLYAGTNASI